MSYEARKALARLAECDGERADARLLAAIHREGIDAPAIRHAAIRRLAEASTDANTPNREEALD